MVPFSLSSGDVIVGLKLEQKTLVLLSLSNALTAIHVRVMQSWGQ